MDDGEPLPPPELKALVSALRCPICQDTMKGPVAPSQCMHTFCSDCIRSTLDFNQRANQKQTCPSCRVPINANDLKRQDTVRHILEVIPATITAVEGLRERCQAAEERAAAAEQAIAALQEAVARYGASTAAAAPASAAPSSAAVRGSSGGGGGGGVQGSGDQDGEQHGVGSAAARDDVTMDDGQGQPSSRTQQQRHARRSKRARHEGSSSGLAADADDGAGGSNVDGTVGGEEGDDWMDGGDGGDDLDDEDYSPGASGGGRQGRGKQQQPQQRPRRGPGRPRRAETPATSRKRTRAGRRSGVVHDSSDSSDSDCIAAGHRSKDYGTAGIDVGGGAGGRGSSGGGAGAGPPSGRGASGPGAAGGGDDSQAGRSVPPTEDTGYCPICWAKYPQPQLQAHVDMCLTRKGMGFGPSATGSRGGGAPARGAAGPTPLAAAGAIARQAAGAAASAVPSGVGAMLLTGSRRLTPPLPRTGSAAAPLAAVPLTCGGSGQAAAILPLPATAAAARAPTEVKIPPARNWHQMKDKEARKVLRDCGLPDQGTKQDWSDRYNRYRSFLQAERDKCTTASMDQLLRTFIRRERQAEASRRQPAAAPAWMQAQIRVAQEQMVRATARRSAQAAAAAAATVAQQHAVAVAPADPGAQAQPLPAGDHGAAGLALSEGIASGGQGGTHPVGGGAAGPGLTAGSGDGGSGGAPGSASAAAAGQVPDGVITGDAAATAHADAVSDDYAGGPAAQQLPLLQAHGGDVGRGVAAGASGGERGDGAAAAPNSTSAAGVAALGQDQQRGPESIQGQQQQDMVARGSSADVIIIDSSDSGDLGQGDGGVLAAPAAGTVATVVRAGGDDCSGGDGGRGVTNGAADHTGSAPGEGDQHPDVRRTLGDREPFPSLGGAIQKPAGSSLGPSVGTPGVLPLSQRRGLPLAELLGRSGGGSGGATRGSVSADRSALRSAASGGGTTADPYEAGVLRSDSGESSGEEEDQRGGATMAGGGGGDSLGGGGKVHTSGRRRLSLLDCLAEAPGAEGAESCMDVVPLQAGGSDIHGECGTSLQQYQQQQLADLGAGSSHMPAITPAAHGHGLLPLSGLGAGVGPGPVFGAGLKGGASATGVCALLGGPDELGVGRSAGRYGSSPFVGAGPALGWAGLGPARPEAAAETLPAGATPAASPYPPPAAAAAVGIAGDVSMGVAVAAAPAASAMPMGLTDISNSAGGQPRTASSVLLPGPRARPWCELVTFRANSVNVKGD